jgi:flagellin
VLRHGRPTRRSLRHHDLSYGRQRDRRKRLPQGPRRAVQRNRKQIDTIAKDAGYNGVNLLNGDDLTVQFNEDNTSTLSIKGVSMSSAGDLGVSSATVADTSTADNNFQTNAQIKTLQGQLDEALTTLRTQASKFGSNLAGVQTRQDFTKGMVDTLRNGADSLTLADPNEEGASLLALNTRAQLSSTALSLASQADQAVLRLC